VDRNFLSPPEPATKNGSPSSRRAWIEIRGSCPLRQSRCVALLAEGVDRNVRGGSACTIARRSPSSRRAWIEIGGIWSSLRDTARSPSSRRAWIEISVFSTNSPPDSVALLAEGVDRNFQNAPDLALALCRPPRGGRG